MFLQSLLRSNPAFVNAAIKLHQAGRIPANSYVVDLDMVANNARFLIAEAAKFHLTVFPMTKQFGRNPEVLKVMNAAGFDAYVAVDMTCARAIQSAGFKVGHLGHLVQIPQHEVAEAAAMLPLYWTVFSRAQAAAVDRAMTENLTQRVLLRVYGPGDTVVPTHAGGFSLDDIDADIHYVMSLPNLEIAGITTYPSAVFDRFARKVCSTPNVRTMALVAQKLHRLGISNIQINMASELSTATIAAAAESGATQIEPGHAFTGTSPYQTFADVPERQAILYLSEISHGYDAFAFFFGGGLYECIGAVEHTPEALVGSAGTTGVRFQTAHLTTPPNGVIDFYGRLDVRPGASIKRGDTVIICTRPQVFVTRAFVVPVQGIQSGNPTVLGIWDINGFRAQNAPSHCASVS